MSLCPRRAKDRSRARVAQDVSYPLSVHFIGAKSLSPVVPWAKRVIPNTAGLCGWKWLWVSLCLVAFGAWGWFRCPLPLGYGRVVCHIPSRFAKVSFAIQCAAQFWRKDCKYLFIYKKYLPVPENVEEKR